MTDDDLQRERLLSYFNGYEAGKADAAEQAAKERELLGKAREIVCYVAAFVDNPGQESIARAWLAEYAALQTKEQP